MAGRKANRFRNPKVRDLEKDSVSRKKKRSALNVYLSHHLWVAVSSLGQLWRSPFSTLLTSAVIAISLALPFGLQILLDNVERLTAGWRNSAQISLYLKQDIHPSLAKQTASRIKGWEEVEAVEYISSEQALEEFKQLSGFGGALDVLQDNPLPAVLLVKPAAGFEQAARLELLLGRLGKLRTVDQAQLDMDWVRRLGALIRLGERGIFLLAGLLGVGVLLVIGNTIRLTIYNRRQEIVVTKLIGATNWFIRRPFLYTGFWYGLFGAVLAWMLVILFLGLLKGPVDDLALLYNSTFSIKGIDVKTGMAIYITGVFLGLSGAWLAVARHLQAIEPK